MRLLDKPLEQKVIEEMNRMINGNICRINVSDDVEEIVNQLGFAVNSLALIAYSRTMELSINQSQAKKPFTWIDGCGDDKKDVDMYDCPRCGKSYKTDCEKYDYCPNCGQAIDWG